MLIRMLYIFVHMQQQIHHFPSLQELYVENDPCVTACQSTKGNDSSMAYTKVRQVAQQQCIAQHKSTTRKVDCEHLAMITCARACSKARRAPAAA